MDSDNNDETFISSWQCPKPSSTRSEWQAEQQVGGAYSETLFLGFYWQLQVSVVITDVNTFQVQLYQLAEAVNCLGHGYPIMPTTPCAQVLALCECTSHGPLN
jgi:hypothetical protein